jgi:hypothetical protein
MKITLEGITIISCDTVGLVKKGEMHGHIVCVGFFGFLRGRCL